MKRKICLILLLAFILTGCAPVKEKNNKEHLKVLTSFHPIFLLAQEVTKGVDGIDLYNMAQPQTGCLHDYTLTTGDMQKLQEADVLLINGAGMENFLEQALKQFPELIVVDTSEGIDLLESQHSHYHEHGELDEHEIEGEIHNSVDAFAHEECGNSHIWLSPSRVQKQVENMVRGLTEVLPQEKGKIKHNGQDVLQQLISLQKEAETYHHNHDGHVNVAVFHEGFAYLTEVFYLNAHVQIFVEENVGPSAKELAEAVDEIRKEGIEYYLVADDAGRKYAEVLAKECGGQVIVLNPITGGTMEGESYASIMEDNIKLIEKCLEEEHHGNS